MPQVRERLAVAMDKLTDLYPEARFPTITIAVGRGKPVGVGSRDTGVQIGLEALCATDFINPDIEDQLDHLGKEARNPRAPHRQRLRHARVRQAAGLLF